jgi:TolB-like protein
MRGIGLFIGILVLTASPTQAKDNAGINSLNKSLKAPAAAILTKLKGKVCVMDFSDLSQSGYTSEFGQKVSDLLSNVLVNRNAGGYTVMERRELVKILHDSILMVGDDGKAIEDLQKQGGMDVLVSGTYSVAGPEVSIDVKAVDAHSGGVLASATTRIKTTEGLKSMLSHRFKEFGPEPSETPPQAQSPSATTPPASQASEGSHGDVDVLELETGVFYEGGDGKLYPLREGMVLNSKDNYAVYFRPKTPCYVYVYQVDSAQKAFSLFPNKDFVPAGNPTTGGKEVWIPSGKDYLYLDENVGREEIYIFATRRPTPSLEGLHEARLSEIQQAIKTMGVAGKRGSETVNHIRGTQGDALELVTRKLAAQGDFFYKLSFIHQ